MISNLRETQKELEGRMKEDAQRRLIQDNVKAQGRSAWGESHIGKAFVRSATRAFAKSVEAFLTPKTGPGRNVRAAEKLIKTGIEPGLIAYLFTKGIFNMAIRLDDQARKARFYNGVKRVSLCIKAVGAINDEWRIRLFADTDFRKNLLQVILKDMEKRGYPREWKVRTLRNQFRAQQVEWEGWSQRDRLQIGHALLVLFMEAVPGILQYHVHSETGKVQKHYIEPTDRFYELLTKALEDRGSNLMTYKPMVVKPLPWTLDHMFRGGYLTNQVKPFPMILRTGAKDVSRLMSADMTIPLKAINALQETPFRVNRRIYDVFSWIIKDRRGGVGSVPDLDPIPLPPIPHGYKVDPDVTKAHNHQVFLLHDKNRQNKSKAFNSLLTLTVADQFKDYEEIYFPHFFDHRGRAYPKSTYLNPQGTDYAKALLEFSKGHVIESDHQRDWIAIAAANAYGKDKVSLQDRVLWIHTNRELWLSISKDPYHDLRWTEAADPFQFLRACFELADYEEAVMNGKQFISHMVVPVDATCSGLQHYAAMLADEVGGRSVNLVPGLPRQDVYGDVAERVVAILKAKGGEEAMNLLAFGIDRATVKRQVMVVPYAATMSSCLHYTRVAIEDKLDAGHKPEWDVSDRQVRKTHIKLLAFTIWEAIQDVVLKGREAMEWLSKVAREWAKHVNKHHEDAPAIECTLPDGFPVRHVVFADQEKRVSSFLDGAVNLTYYEASKKVDSRSMGTSFPPNFIHSFDACHLRMSINRGLINGITDYCMVHDSFGVHAAKMTDFLSKCVKPAFIDMYDGHNRLKELRSLLPEDLDLPPQPTRGSLDLKGVAQSEYFFS